MRNVLDNFARLLVLFLLGLGILLAIFIVVGILALIVLALRARLS